MCGYSFFEPFAAFSDRARTFKVVFLRMGPDTKVENQLSKKKDKIVALYVKIIVDK